MLTATIEQECSASIKHRALLVLHTQTTILNHCLITLSNDLTECLQQKSQLQDRLSVSATVTNNTKITTVYNNKHLDGGLRSHFFFFFSPKKQTHNQKIQLSCSSQITNIAQLEHHFP